MQIAIIGAGLSGITAIKQLKDQNHEVFCFEASKDFGGVFSEDGCYDSVKLTVSNYFMAYSDLPPTGEDVKFWSRKEYKDYLKRYLEYYDLAKHIQYNSRLESLERANGSWTLHFCVNGKTEIHTFDAVAVCSGMFQVANIIKIPGAEDFNGTILHSKDYKNASPFREKKVLCVGLGESSADVTTEIGEVARSCALSLRRYPSVASRYVKMKKKQLPGDMSPITTRMMSTIPFQIYKKIDQIIVDNRKKKQRFRCSFAR